MLNTSEGSPTTWARRARIGAAAGALALIASGCGLTSSGDATGAESAPETSGSVGQLCAVAAQWRQPVADAEAAGLAQLADAKVAYFQAAQAVAPGTWSDNIAEILPAWQTLTGIIAEAEGDLSRIDIEKFSADFADATANEVALQAFVDTRCTG